VEVGPDDFTVEHWCEKDETLKPLPLEKTRCGVRCGNSAPLPGLDQNIKSLSLMQRTFTCTHMRMLLNISANENVSEVKEVTVKNYTGKQHRVKAKYFILAVAPFKMQGCCFLQTKQAAKGLGNDYDHVGRYFMEHLEIKTGSLWLADPADVKLYMMQFGVTKQEQN
jgi:hypothetical protein